MECFLQRFAYEGLCLVVELSQRWFLYKNESNLFYLCRVQPPLIREGEHGASLLSQLCITDSR